MYTTGTDTVANLKEVNKSKDLTNNKYEVKYPDQLDNGLLLAAFVINLIVLVCSCWLVIPLAWMIPMTVSSYRAYKGIRPNTVALGVCTLIFFDLIGGILMLCAPKNN
ncbi:MAG: hypothetical protein LBR30_03665 [Clostridioides sp.]|nr:hypothetical protein [Clostridioides sp.]